MKKTNNKGFSLVELIIVIAIMAILAGAIAPALIKYIDKSRKSNDVSSAKTIKTAIETALGNESIYEYITGGSSFCYISITPGKSLTDGTTGAQTAISISGAYAGTDKINGKSTTELEKTAKDTIGSNIGEKSPKLKYQKDPAGGDKKPSKFVGVVSPAGTVYVFIQCGNGSSFSVKDSSSTGVEPTTSGTGYQITPYICDEYQ